MTTRKAQSKPAPAITAAEILAMASKSAEAVAVVPAAPVVVAAVESELMDRTYQRIGGTTSRDFNTTVWYKLTSSIYVHPDDPGGIVRHRINEAAAEAMRAFKPTDAIEAMIASQAIGMHFAVMACLSRATHPTISYENLSRLQRDAANLARGMTDMVDALDRKRGKRTPQVVRVERVTVEAGAQAVVGNVSRS
jgi:hypothetical protein